MSGPETDNERPPDDELDRMYRQLLEELSIPESKRGSMMAQPMHMKWKLLSKHQRYVRVQSSSYGSYGGAVRCVQILDRMLVNEEDLETSGDVIDFRVEVKADQEWIQVFLELGGIKKLIVLLDGAIDRVRFSTLNDLLECLLVLVKGSTSTLALLLDEFQAVVVITACLPPAVGEKDKSKVADTVLKILNIVASHSSDGHSAVQQAFHIYREEKQEPMAYTTLMNYLRDEQVEADLKTNVLKMFNTILKSTLILEQRVCVRSDLAFMGILQALDDIEGMLELLSDGSEQREELSSLANAVSDFRNSAAIDNQSVLRAAPVNGSWLANIGAVFARVERQARSIGSAQQLMRLLHSCLVIPAKAPTLGLQLWSLLADTTQRVVTNPDASGMCFSEVEQNYLRADERFEKLKIDQNQIQDLSKEVSQLRDQVACIEKKHKAELEQLKTAHANELALAKTRAPTALNEAAVSSGVPSAAAAAALAAAATSPTNSTGDQASSNTTPVSSGGRFASYLKMKKAGLPDAAIEHKMTKDGLSESDKDEFFGRNASKQTAPEKSASKPKKPLDPKYDKYVKMQKVLPEAVVRNAMIRDGLSESDQKDFFGEEDQQQEEEEEFKEEDEGPGQPDPALRQDPKFEKFFRMQNAGLPEGAILNAMAKESIPASDQDRFFGRKPSNKKKKEPKLKDKPKQEPRKPMRALFWSKLPNERVEGTLWQELDDSKIEIDLDGLEAGFCTVQKKPKAKTPNQEEAKREDASSKPVELVDPKRRQNVGIAFARLKLSPQMLKACILDMDLKRLGGGLDRVKLLKNLVPTKEEQALINDFTGDKSRLAKVEQIFLELGAIPSPSDIIQSWIIQLAFKQRVAETRESVETFIKACNEIKESAALKQTLRVVLAVGNYLNGKTSRGGAYGFKLDVLNSLDTTKSSDGKSTLLKYVVRNMAESKYQVMTRLPKELGHLEEAHRISLSGLSSTCKEHQKDIAFVKKVLDTIDPESNFSKKACQFLESGEKTLSHLQTAMKSAEDQYGDVLKLFAPGDEEFEASSEAFIGLFHRFVQSFQRQLSPPEEKARRKTHTQKHRAALEKKTAPRQVHEQKSAGLSVLDEIKSRKGKLSSGARKNRIMKPAPEKAPNILDQIRARGKSN